MDRYRLIGSIIFLYVMLLTEYPLPTIITTIVIIAAYLIIRFAPNIGANNKGFYNIHSNRGARLAALDVAAIYLSPYTDIWRNLKLTNKNCIAILGHNGERIVVREKTHNTNAPYRTFRIIQSKRYNMQEVWNMFCLNFDYHTTYDDLVFKCKELFKVSILESYNGNTSVSSTASKIYKNNKSVIENNTSNDNIKKVDINNASEIELTELPGISIVISKKIIKKREEINGFKNIHDFFMFIKVKPHMEEQLKDKICVNEMKGSLKIERFQERHIDF